MYAQSWVLTKVATGCIIDMKFKKEGENIMERKYNLEKDIFVVVCKTEDPECSLIAPCHLSADNTVLTMFEHSGAKNYAISRIPTEREEAMAKTIEYYKNRTEAKEVIVTDMATVANRYAKLSIFDYLFANGKNVSSRKLSSEKPKYTKDLTQEELVKRASEFTEEMRKDEPKFTDDEPTL